MEVIFRQVRLSSFCMSAVYIDTQAKCRSDENDTSLTMVHKKITGWMKSKTGD